MCSSYKLCHTTIHTWLIQDQEESKCFHEIFAVNNTVNKHTVAWSWCYLAIVLGHLSRFPTKLVTLVAPHSCTTLAVMWSNWWYLKPCRGEMIQRQPTCWAEDSHATIVYLYLSCVRANNTLQSLLRDVGQCCKEALSPSIALWRDGMCCTAAIQ